jgi:ribonucleoside-triphosphate reductase (thioredoxin)
MNTKQITAKYADFIPDKNPPWGTIGYITFKRTYARRKKEEGPETDTEEFRDLVARELEAMDRQLGLHLNNEEKRKYAESRMNLWWTPAGRFLWQLNSKTVDRIGLSSLMNCAFTVVDHPVDPFVWAFDMLMLGSGVGFNVQKHNVFAMPKLKGKIKIERMETNDADFLVPDSREGWIKLLSKVLKAHFYGGKGFTYSTVCVRGKGVPIKGFGGVSSGPEELCKGIAQIHNILNSRANKKLRPIDCLDIMCIVGEIVVSGNIRRSALISLGDHDDAEYLRAKRWDLGPIPNWRSRVNMSIVTPDNFEEIPELFWQTYEQGEPFGLINLKSSKEQGRIGDFRFPDPNIQGVNPCGEQSLEDKETCCLQELYLPKIPNYESLLECISFAYRLAKHSLALPCHLKNTEEVVHRNMRMGIGVTGYLEATEEQKSWLSSAYEWLRKYDREYSEKMGWPISIKLTTCKPSGTVSLLPGVTPGVHPSPAGPYYIRRISIASNSPLIETCRKHGVHIEPRLEFDGSFDRTTVIASFPCKTAPDTPVAANFSWHEQLSQVIRLQKEWVDNSVSCTIYYKKEDIPAIRKYLSKHIGELKAVSF